VRIDQPWTADSPALTRADRRSRRTPAAAGAAPARPPVRTSRSRRTPATPRARTPRELSRGGSWGFVVAAAFGYAGVGEGDPNGVVEVELVAVPAARRPAHPAPVPPGAAALPASSPPPAHPATSPHQRRAHAAYRPPPALHYSRREAIKATRRRAAARETPPGARRALAGEHRRSPWLNSFEDGLIQEGGGRFNRRGYDSCGVAWERARIKGRLFRVPLTTG
jgi:hypothetical protein